LRLLGGGKKKRKKKIAVVPPEKRHRHKNVPLAMLKYYDVNEHTGEVKTLRATCPAEICGTGVFMAYHSVNQRHHCGKCGLSYLPNSVTASC
jgi:ribosomal protein S27AE